MIIMTGITPTTVLTRRLVDAYGWPPKVARLVVTNYADRLTDDNLFDDRGYLTDDGMAEASRLIVVDNGQPPNPDALVLPAPVKVAKAVATKAKAVRSVRGTAKTNTATPAPKRTRTTVKTA
jgi:hypothetical protein